MQTDSHWILFCSWKHCGDTNSRNIFFIYRCYSLLSFPFPSTMASKTAPVNVGAPNQTWVLWLVPCLMVCIADIGCSLYCKNLPDKIKKANLRTALYTLFSTYGTVLDIVAMRTRKLRGQAHVVFRDIQASTQAMRALQGFDFFGKEMVSLTK